MRSDSKILPLFSQVRSKDFSPSSTQEFLGELQNVKTAFRRSELLLIEKYRLEFRKFAFRSRLGI